MFFQLLELFPMYKKRVSMLNFVRTFTKKKKKVRLVAGISFAQLISYGRMLGR